MTDAYERAKRDDEAWEREHDTREKLEADAGELVADYARNGSVCDALYHGILALLDRQAAITERHWMEISGANTLANIELNKQREELQSKVDELQAERDEWRELYGEMSHERCDAIMREDELQAKVDTMRDVTREFRDERDELQAELVATKKSLGLAQARVHELRAELSELRPKRTVEDVLWDFKIGNLTRNDAAAELRGMWVRDE